MRAAVVLLALSAACGGADDVAPDGPDAGHPPTSTTLVIQVTDGPGGPPLPAKVVLYDESGATLRIGSRDMYDGSAQDRGYCDLGGGAVGTWDGIALLDGSGEIPVADDFCLPGPAVPFGTYGMRVLHGIDHEMYETHVTLEPLMGRVVVNVPLQRAWTATGALAADLHVHADPSGDSNVPEWVRVVSELATGIDVIGASDHNYNGNYDEVIETLGVRGKVAALSGNEITIDMLHANVFPALVDPSRPDGGASSYDALRGKSARQLMDYMRALPRAPLVQLNHPRLRFAAYFDYAGWDGVSWPPPMPIDFDALEVFTGWYMFNVPGDARLDQAIGDFYTFMRHGKVVTAMGNSDTHHLNGILAGVPRNYVTTGASLDPFDEDAFVDAVRRRHVLITTGPYLTVAAGAAGPGDLVAAAGGKVALAVALRQASFVKANRVRIWVDGQLRETLPIADGSLALDWSGEVAVPGRDSWIGVDALGDQGLPIELTGDSHFTVGGMLPAALINPILVDGDGDGRWSVASAPLAPEIDLLPPPWDGRRAPLDCGPPEAR